MRKAESAIRKLEELAKNSYQCSVKARIDYFPSKREFIEIDDVGGAELFVCLFCAEFPDEIDGFPIYLSEAFKNKIYDLPFIEETAN